MYQNILSPRQLEARGKNAVAELLGKRLIVPKIFFDAPWPNSRSCMDVLAVDRAGAGDIHVVEVKTGVLVATDAIHELMLVPAHYKYVAILEPGNYQLAHQILYPENEQGRVGVIRFAEQEHDRLIASFEIVPERFRVRPEVIKQIDRFTARQHADIEVRV